MANFEGVTRFPENEGLSRRRRKGVREEEPLEDEGAAEEKGQLLLLSYGNGNEVGHGAGDNGRQRQVERHRVNCFLLGSHLAPTFTD